MTLAPSCGDRTYFYIDGAVGVLSCDAVAGEGDRRWAVEGCRPLLVVTRPAPCAPAHRPRRTASPRLNRSRECTAKSHVADESAPADGHAEARTTAPAPARSSSAAVISPASASGSARASFRACGRPLHHASHGPPPPFHGRGRRLRAALWRHVGQSATCCPSTASGTFRESYPRIEPPRYDRLIHVFGI